MLISASSLDRWFGQESDQERPSYAARLRRTLSDQELKQVEELFRRQLTGQTVPWRSLNVYLLAGHPAE
jgi:hypothetical protein